MEEDQKARALRLAAQLVLAEQLADREGADGARGRLRMAISIAAGNAHNLARSLGVTEEEVQAETEALRGHGTYKDSRVHAQP